MQALKRYPCYARLIDSIPEADHRIWGDLPALSLVTADTDQPPALSTTAKAFFDPKGECLYLGFWAEDEGVVSDFTRRDDPIFQQDVLECFLCDTDALYNYKELQVSPFNVQYDAQIVCNGVGDIEVDLSWDFDDWRSLTRFDPEKRLLTSVWALPFSGFAQRPKAGDSWRWNLFRCDHTEGGVALSAWSAPGILNFHVPERFGWLDFM